MTPDTIKALAERLRDKAKAMNAFEREPWGKHHPGDDLFEAADLLDRLATQQSGVTPETLWLSGTWYDRRDTVDALTSLLADARAQIERDKEHYEAAMAMSEKHRRLWVEECQKNKTHQSRNWVREFRNVETFESVRPPFAGSSGGGS